MELVRSHSGPAEALAGGVHALPGVGGSLAATQAAYRFFNNPNVTLADVAEPMIELAHEAASTDRDRYLLIAQDWSQVMYPGHDSKRDRVPLSSRNVPEGCGMRTALLVSDRAGDPLDPLEIGLRAADGVQESRSSRPRPPLSPLDELAPMMRPVEGLGLGKPAVHIIDAEADSAFHYRDWHAAGHLFLARADDRLAESGGTEKRFSTIQTELREQGTFRDVRDVLHRGNPARQYVAETEVVLTRAAEPPQGRRPPADCGRGAALAVGARGSPRGGWPGSGDVVPADECSTRGRRGDNRAVVRLALEHRGVVPAAEVRRTTDRDLATGTGGGNRPAAVGGRDGLRHGVARRPQPAPPGGRRAIDAHPPQRSADETRRQVHAARAPGGPVDLAGDAGPPRTSHPR